MLMTHAVYPSIAKVEKYTSHKIKIAELGSGKSDCDKIFNLVVTMDSRRS